MGEAKRRRMKSEDNSKPCLHCLLVDTIGAFYQEHPYKPSDAGTLALIANVIGDQLASSGSTPLREEFIDRINRRIRYRTKVMGGKHGV